MSMIVGIVLRLLLSKGAVALLFVALGGSYVGACSQQEEKAELRTSLEQCVRANKELSDNLNQCDSFVDSYLEKEWDKRGSE